MSSPFSQPANKPLEQLKVTELKEELRKRGLSLKGVKKELFDRLEEAVKKEVEAADNPSGEPVFSGEIQLYETVKDDVLMDTHEVKVDAPIHAHPHQHDVSVAAHGDVIVDPHVSRVDVDTHVGAKLEPYVDIHQDVKVDSHVDIHRDVIVDAHVDTHQDVKVDTHMDIHQDVKSLVHMDTNHGYGTASASQGITCQMKETSSEYMDLLPKGLDDVAVGNDGIVSGYEESSLTDLSVLNAGICAQDHVDDENGFSAHSVDVKVLTEELESVQGRREVMIVEVEHPIIEPPHGQEQAQEAMAEPLYGLEQVKYTMVDPPHGQEQAQKAECPVVNPQEAEHTLADPTHGQVPPEAEFHVVDPSDGHVKAKEVECPAVSAPHGQVKAEEAKSHVVDPYHGQVHTEEAESPVVDPPHGQAQSEEAACPVVDQPHGREETHWVDPTLGEVQTEEAKCTMVAPYSGQIVTEIKPFIQPSELVKSAEASYDKEIPEAHSAAFMDLEMEEVERLTSQPTTPEHVLDLPDGLDFDESDRLQVETETQPEEEPAVVSDGCRQMEVEQEEPKRDHSSMQKYRDELIRPEGRTGGLSKEVDFKSADVEFRDDTRPKRKYDEREMKNHEPAKRIRKWNSGNSLVVEVSEPLTTDTVKEIMPAEVKEKKSTPKVLATSRSSTQPVARAERVASGEKNGKPQAVPAPTRPPTTSLKIERFIRPFTLNAVKDLLAEYGRCVDFWMDQIKTHCYVTYSAVDEAITARNALYGRQWPSTFGNQLVVEFVDGQEVKIRCNGLSETAHIAPVMTPRGRPALAPSQAAAVHTSTAPLPPPPLSRDRQALLPLKREPEPPIPTLDDLFKKTKAKPHIYYLPLTDEQVAAKLAVKTKERQSKFSAPVRS